MLDQKLRLSYHSCQKQTLERPSLSGRLLLQYGRAEITEITKEIEGKTEEDVRIYSKTYWERYTELADHDRIIKNIGAPPPVALHSPMGM
jgi:hypothetical protein